MQMNWIHFQKNNYQILLEKKQKASINKQKKDKEIELVIKILSIEEAQGQCFMDKFSKTFKEFFCKSLKKEKKKKAT